MRRILGIFPAVLLSIVVSHNGITFAGENNYGEFAQSYSRQLACRDYIAFASALSLVTMWAVCISKYISDVNAEGDPEAERENSTDLSSSQSNISSNFNTRMKRIPIPGYDQKAMIDHYNLAPFNLSEDNYTGANKKLKYLWARATFLNTHPPHLNNEGSLQPALFPLNTAYDPSYSYGNATRFCISSLPAPLTNNKKFRCNDQQLTGFCRVKLMINGKTSTLVGMLANTADNVSGCLLSSRKNDDFLASLEGETLVPKDILITDKRYYQINVIYKNTSYQFQELPGYPVPFASTVMLSGSLRHESLCKNDASPGTQWFNDGARSEYECSGLTAEASPTGEISYFVPIRQKSLANRQSLVTWQEIPSQENKGAIKTEVETNFCSPRKPYKEFILGSLAGLGSDKYCRYIGTSGKTGYVATNQDGSIASDYLTPTVEGNIRWEAFENDLPDKAIIAGYSFASSGKEISKVPQYFCRFVNNGFRVFGQFFNKDKVCKTSFVTPNGDSNALINSKTFEILVRD